MKNIGTLVTAAIRPNDSNDKIASAYAVEVKGGLHSYATLLERNNIISERREWGMIVNVYNDTTPSNNTTWVLKYNKVNTTISDNANWEKYLGSSGSGSGSAYWIDPVMGILSNQPSGPNNGDRYILGPTPTGLSWGSKFENDVVQYDLDTLFSAVSESGKRIEVVKVFHDAVPAINRFFDPYSVSGQGTLNLIDEFGFGSYSPAAQFVLMPMFEDLLRIQAIEFNDQFRKSAFTFNIVNGKMRVFPMPTSSNVNLYGKLYFDYYVKDEFTENSTLVTPNVISDYSDIPYNFMEYSGINDVGKQWIRKYTLALAKELLGAVREKYSNIPIPGSEVSLDGAALRSEAQTEKEALMTQLRETLEELSRKIQFENRNNEANQHQEMLRKVPLAIYIG